MLSLTAQVLQLIRRADAPLSKADIADRLGVSLSAVSDHVERLMREGLIAFSSIGSSSGGRKPKQYALNSGYGYIISIVLGTTYAQVALTDFNCRIVEWSSQPVDIGLGPDRVLTSIYEQIQTLLTQHEIEADQIKGIGLGVPGPVEFHSGRPISPPLMPGWDGYPVKEFWAGRFACPCFVDNDVNVMALGEYAKGLHFEVDSLIYIKVGTGIGSGIIYDGKLYRGANGGAGDIGHFDTGSDVLCWCGNRGCLEATAGGKAIIAKGRELALSKGTDGFPGKTPEEESYTFRHIEAGLLRLDPDCLELVRESGAAIGRVVASLVNFSNPSLIAVGGRISEFGDVFLAAIRQSVYQRSLPLATRNLKINPSVLGRAAGLVGGAFMTIDEMIKEATNDRIDLFF
ncbi:Sugar kinase of the NBD/HSP70 family, may contain an N-terminal HTH domain [Paenibacillus sp. UNCCL117]|uniref:ROK family transcriptional regulator n=1 Tax=unclassified Paenibacillus TaxID=185978 RepID=UPI0008825BA9|nr:MULTISPECIES: ROK family transcriptional regulator [unclassified Paenibacillus]SDD55585.1 Sugar kinase of the NBD/HSP70 family, may contain an N-terminal HTH domain [Paenibacillus sp. cl123]SFW51558.1 Sugar kinase of the NBD/HSP70 family, may contain an N-terminal HTH domain [Paenibacillus sp. UNCCL117]